MTNETWFLTFKDFQATGRAADLRDHADVIGQMGDDLDGPVMGRVYVMGLYIQGDETDPGNGDYYLTIGNTSVCGKLETLERQLYEFAVSEGYIEGCDL